MNAAFLLVTSAWFTCQPPPSTTTAPAMGMPAATMGSGPAVVSSSMGCSGGGCGGATGYDGCCGYDACCGSSWGGRLKGLFHKNNCNTCCDTCNTGCGGSGGGGFFGGRSGGMFGGSSGSGCCDTCSTGGGSSWGGRLKGLFHRNNTCCDTGCGCDGGCGSSGIYGGYGGSAAPAPLPATGTVPPGAEQLAPPSKKMPSSTTPKSTETKGQVRINNVPNTTGSPIAPATPNIEVVPPAVPSLEAERRDPPF